MPCSWTLTLPWLLVKKHHQRSSLSPTLPSKRLQHLEKTRTYAGDTKQSIPKLRFHQVVVQSSVVTTQWMNESVTGSIDSPPLDCLLQVFQRRNQCVFTSNRVSLVTPHGQKETRHWGVVMNCIHSVYLLLTIHPIPMPGEMLRKVKLNSDITLEQWVGSLIFTAVHGSFLSMATGVHSIGLVHGDTNRSVYSISRSGWIGARCTYPVLKWKKC